jgi:uncharacterized protein
MAMLEMAAEQGLSDWCLAAGFVRNLAWDRLHGYASATVLNDIDLIHFDREDPTEARDRRIEQVLVHRSGLPWSVKNQARMHERNRDAPYASTRDAMSCWVEVETAVGAALDDRGKIELVSAFGIEPLFDLTVTFECRKAETRGVQTTRHGQALAGDLAQACAEGMTGCAGSIGSSIHQY